MKLFGRFIEDEVLPAFIVARNVNLHDFMKDVGTPFGDYVIVEIGRGATFPISSDSITRGDVMLIERRSNGVFTASKTTHMSQNGGHWRYTQRMKIGRHTTM